MTSKTIAKHTAKAGSPANAAVMGGLTDIGACLCTCVVVVLVCVGMFADVKGGNMPPQKWFPWHTVFMTLSFLCLMPLGRYAYIFEQGSSNRRSIHKFVQSFAVIAMLVGYLCIFMAHLPAQKYFGYDFKHGKWSPDYKRVLHAWIGYALLLLVLIQAAVGFMKAASYAKEKGSIYKWHGSLGKAIMLLGGINVLLAIRFWAWNKSMQVPLYIFTIASMLIGAVWPRPAAVQEGETQPILPQRDV